MAFTNPTTDEIRDLLGAIRRIAVVGLSPKPARPSHQVASALQQFGYQIIPVRPAVDEVLGEPAYPNLADVPDPIDLVDVFRAPDQIAPIIDVCIERRLPAIWLQDGVVNEAEAQRARDAGLTVIMDRCIYRDYMQLMR
ncbi:MAG: CoA-binding protein [Thiohalophilus sp.]